MFDLNYIKTGHYIKHENVEHFAVCSDGIDSILRNTLEEPCDINPKEFLFTDVQSANGLQRMSSKQDPKKTRAQKALEDEMVWSQLFNQMVEGIGNLFTYFEFGKGTPAEAAGKARIEGNPPKAKAPIKLNDGVPQSKPVDGSHIDYSEIIDVLEKKYK